MNAATRISASAVVPCRTVSNADLRLGLSISGQFIDQIGELGPVAFTACISKNKPSRTLACIMCRRTASPTLVPPAEQVARLCLWRAFTGPAIPDQQSRQVRLLLQVPPSSNLSRRACRCGRRVQRRLEQDRRHLDGHGGLAKTGPSFACGLPRLQRSCQWRRRSSRATVGASGSGEG